MTRQSWRTCFRKLEFKSLIERLDLRGCGRSVGSGSGRRAANLTIGHCGGSTRTGWSELDATLADSGSGLYVEAIGDNPHQAEVIGLAVASGERSRTCCRIDA